jgi:hypothetical protein
MKKGMVNLRSKTSLSAQADAALNLIALAGECKIISEAKAWSAISTMKAILEFDQTLNCLFFASFRQDGSMKKERFKFYCKAIDVIRSKLKRNKKIEPIYAMVAHWNNSLIPDHTITAKTVTVEINKLRRNRKVAK